jgi:hypothetical protein
MRRFFRKNASCPKPIAVFGFKPDPPLDFDTTGGKVGGLTLQKRHTMIDELPPEDGAPGLRLLLTNGDMRVTNEIVKRHGFKDAASLIRFALAVFDQAALRAVTITDADGKRYTLTPTDTLLAAPSTPEPPQ